MASTSFLGYLNVPAHVYATVHVIMTLPWSFKFAFGLAQHASAPIGYRRKPYMVIGWAICCAVLLHLAAKPLPEPYWCRDPDTGAYITKVTKSDGSHGAAKPCNAHAAKEGGAFALLACAALGYVVADVAADGLTVQYLRAASAHFWRGSTQTLAYAARASAAVVNAGRARNSPAAQFSDASRATTSAGTADAHLRAGRGGVPRRLRNERPRVQRHVPAGSLLLGRVLHPRDPRRADGALSWMAHRGGEGADARFAAPPPPADVVGAAAVARLLLCGALPVPHAGDLRRVDDGGRPRQELLGRRPESAEPDLLARRPRALRRRVRPRARQIVGASRGG